MRHVANSYVKNVKRALITASNLTPEMKRLAMLVGLDYYRNDSEIATSLF